MFNALYLVAKDAIKIIEKHMIQSKIIGDQNLWIAKPGGLSRGRNIKIFNHFQEILNYCNAVPETL